MVNITPMKINDPYLDVLNTNYIFKKAIKRGIMIRPQTCEKCGKKTKIVGHHPDYKKPLDVIWLCNSCHRNLHNEINRNFCTSLPESFWKEFDSKEGQFDNI